MMMVRIRIMMTMMAMTVNMTMLMMLMMIMPIVLTTKASKKEESLVVMGFAPSSSWQMSLRLFVVVKIMMRMMKTVIFWFLIWHEDNNDGDWCWQWGQWLWQQSWWWCFVSWSLRLGRSQWSVIITDHPRKTMVTMIMMLITRTMTMATTIYFATDDWQWWHWWWQR